MKKEMIINWNENDYITWSEGKITGAWVFHQSTTLQIIRERFALSKLKLVQLAWNGTITI
ncbi:MAG: hypothetical protein ACTSPB_04780 [Candidatus Thorarchaeota archaeon]